MHKKVAAGGLAGVVSVAVVAVLAAFGVSVPAEAASGLTAVLSLAVSYLTKSGVLVDPTA